MDIQSSGGAEPADGRAYCRETVAIFEAKKHKRGSDENWTEFCTFVAEHKKIGLLKEEIKTVSNRIISNPPKVLKGPIKKLVDAAREFLTDDNEGWKDVEITDLELDRAFALRGRKTRSGRTIERYEKIHGNNDFLKNAAVLLGLQSGADSQGLLKCIAGDYIQVRYSRVGEVFCVSIVKIFKFISSDLPVEFEARRSTRSVDDKVKGIVFQNAVGEDTVCFIGKVGRKIDTRSSVFKVTMTKKGDFEHVDLKGVRIMPLGVAQSTPFAHRVWCYRLDKAHSESELDDLRGQCSEAEFRSKFSLYIDEVDEVASWLTSVPNLSI